ncbi:hypothetical protein KEM55_003561 [Ascosphaera atra]|nr:hypothetical protein KEM55_003561 [Ascosphaera atra]
MSAGEQTPGDSTGHPSRKWLHEIMPMNELISDCWLEDRPHVMNAVRRMDSALPARKALVILAFTSFLDQPALWFQDVFQYVTGINRLPQLNRRRSALRGEPVFGKCKRGLREIIVKSDWFCAKELRELRSDMAHAFVDCVLPRANLRVTSKTRGKLCQWGANHSNDHNPQTPFVIEDPKHDAKAKLRISIRGGCYHLKFTGLDQDLGFRFPTKTEHLPRDRMNIGAWSDEDIQFLDDFAPFYSPSTNADGINLTTVKAAIHSALEQGRTELVKILYGRYLPTKTHFNEHLSENYKVAISHPQPTSSHLVKLLIRYEHAPIPFNDPEFTRWALALRDSDDEFGAWLLDDKVVLALRDEGQQLFRKGRRVRMPNLHCSLWLDDPRTSRIFEVDISPYCEDRLHMEYINQTPLPVNDLNSNPSRLCLKTYQENWDPVTKPMFMKHRGM